MTQFFITPERQQLHEREAIREMNRAFAKYTAYSFVGLCVFAYLLGMATIGADRSVAFDRDNQEITLRGSI